MNDKVKQWLLDGRDTGTSSKTIVAFMEGGFPIDRHSYPHDPSDLGRCLRLLEIAPEYRANLKSMRILSPEWERLIDHWDELEALYRKEEWTGSAPECFDLMYLLTTGKEFPKRPPKPPKPDPDPVREAELQAERERQRQYLRSRYGNDRPDRIADNYR